MKKISHLIIIVFALISFPGCLFIYSNFDFFAPIEPLEEQVISGSGRNRILMIDLTGEIIDQDTSSLLGFTTEESMISLLREQLKMAEDNKNIKAVLLRINSPGGSVTASDILYQQLHTFRQESKIPIYAMMMDVAASGGYYVSMAADKIYAHPTTITGSIGVIMFNLSLEGLMKKVGVKSKIVKSGKNKDIGSFLKDFSPEEKKILQDIIDDLYNRFVEVIETGRPELTKAQILNAADGRVYTAKQAKELGLIDGISYLPDLIDQIKSDLNLEKAKVVFFKRPHQQASNIYSKIQNPHPPQLTLFDPALTRPLTRSQTLPGFYYLWEPSAL
jgi:protease-4